MVFEAFSSGFYIVQHSSLDFLFTTFSLGYYHHKCMYYGVLEWVLRVIIMRSAAWVRIHYKIQYH